MDPGIFFSSHTFDSKLSTPFYHIEAMQEAKGRSVSDHPSIHAVDVVDAAALSCFPAAPVALAESAFGSGTGLLFLAVTGLQAGPLAFLFAERRSRTWYCRTFLHPALIPLNGLLWNSALAKLGGVGGM